MHAGKHVGATLAIGAAAAALALIGAFAIGGGTAAGAAEGWSSCKDVVVEFEPEGSGGGTKIGAKNIPCAKARKVVRICVKGELKPGWSGEYRDPKFRLEKSKKRIRYLPVGGGGCIPVS